MKKMQTAILIILISGLTLSAAACQPEVEEFDEEELIAVSAYVEEMAAALTDETLKADLQGWVREYYEDDLPLRYDQERREWLGEHLTKIESVRNRHLDQSFPDPANIAEWQVLVVREDQEWLLEGSEVLGALEKLDSLVDDLIGTLEMIEQNEGELDMVQSEQVLELVEKIEPETSGVLEVFRR
jgi:hypothetical protein